MSAVTKLPPLHETLVLFATKNHSIRTNSYFQKLHSILVTSGLLHDTFIVSKIIHSLSLSNQDDNSSITYATLLFNQIHKPDVKLWNTMIRALYDTSHPHTCLTYYIEMRRNSVLPNKHTFPLLLKALSKTKNQNPFQIFSEILKLGFGLDSFIGNALVSAFANYGYIGFARQVFDESSHRDEVAYTAMIDGYIKNGCTSEALKCFSDMRFNGVRVDEVCVVSVLCAAGMGEDVWFGRWVHGFYVISGRVLCDVYVGSAIVDMYCKCGYCDDALKFFNEMSCTNVVTWSALIAGHVHCGRFQEALIIFQEMLTKDAGPNQSTLAGLLTACAQIGALDQGRWIHGYIVRKKLDINSMLGTALIDMYSKCGCLREALFIFENMYIKDVYPWTAMINGMAMHGEAFTSLNLFYRMLESGVKPSEITFIGVLSACSHGGLVDEGRRLFRSMKPNHGVEPNINHYGCMVDILGRSGCLEEAKKLIDDMPMEPSPGIWGALFGACMIHKAFEMGEYIGKLLLELQPSHSGRYALLANMYARCNKWEEASEVRKLMKERRVDKGVGCSWIEVNGFIHEFGAFRECGSDSNEVIFFLDTLMLQLKQAGCVSDPELIMVNIDNTADLGVVR